MRNIFPIIFIGISIGIFLMFVSPTYSEVNTIRADVDSYDQALTNAKELQTKQAKLLESSNTIKADDKIRLDHFLPNTVDNIQLILQVQKIATAHGLSLKNVTFDSPMASDQSQKSASKGDNSSYGTFHLSFALDANYVDFMSFLKDIENNLRLINIKTLSFSVPATTKTTQADTTDSGIYTYTLSIETYWLK